MSVVNNGVSIKKQILDMMRSSDKPVSGEYISSQLGFTRVALWKHICSLKESGYNIESSAKGYAIDREDDFLYSWEFPNYENMIVHYSEVESTMDIAMSMAFRDGSCGGKVVVAESQRSGRGTGSREWVSNNGGLFFTLISDKTGMAAHRYSEETMRSCVIVYDIIKKQFGERVSVKWPNDIFLDGKKIAGVLTESYIKGDKVAYSGVGIGINIKNSVPLNNASSILELTGVKISRRAVLQEYLALINDSYKSPVNPVDEFRNRWRDAGKKYSLNIHGQQLSGIMKHIGENGELVIDTGNRIMNIYPGDRDD